MKKIISIMLTMVIIFTTVTLYVIPVSASSVRVHYRTHCQNIGWTGYSNNGDTSGTVGKELQLEAIQIFLAGVSGNVVYRVYCRGRGWTNWGANGGTAGTVGQSLCVEGVQINLNGEVAKQYDIMYRTHCQNIGWTDWSSNGNISGVIGKSLRVEAIQVKLVPKNKNTVCVDLDVPLYKQNNRQWKNTLIGDKTIGQVGCTTTCIAMVYSYHNHQSVTPDQMRYKLKYSNNDLYWSSAEALGLEVVTYNCTLNNEILKNIYSKLKAGKPVIIGATTSNGKGYQHWVVVTGYTGQNTSNFNTKDFIINDPGTQNATTLSVFLENGSRSNRTYIKSIIY